MSLKEKLKPRPKAGNVGKLVICERCGKGGAEHFTPNYVHCPRCDAKPTETKAQHIDTSAGDLFIDFELEFDADEPTQPGYALPLPAPTSFRWYHCARCKIQTKCDPNDVANGKLCGCGGFLRAKP